MTTVHRVYNFSAGPAVLPMSVLEEIQRDLIALPGVGMSILEISHRSAAFEKILVEQVYSQAGSTMDWLVIEYNGIREEFGPADKHMIGAAGLRAACDEKGVLRGQPGHRVQGHAARPSFQWERPVPGVEQAQQRHFSGLGRGH